MVKHRIWYKSWYRRGGITTDKYGNVKKTPMTLRQKGTGYVKNPQGKWLGIEPPRRHHYGTDIHKRKKPKGWHGESLRHSLARSGIKTKR